MYTYYTITVTFTLCSRCDDAFGRISLCDENLEKIEEFTLHFFLKLSYYIIKEFHGITEV